MDKIILRKFTINPITVLVTLSLGLTANVVCAQEIEEEIETMRLETITVIAQKRKQNMQDVPVSVTAISGKQLAEAVLKDIFDVNGQCPGLDSFSKSKCH